MSGEIKYLATLSIQPIIAFFKMFSYIEHVLKAFFKNAIVVYLFSVMVEPIHNMVRMLFFNGILISAFFKNNFVKFLGTLIFVQPFILFKD
jgi:hypothetical protein